MLFDLEPVPAELGRPMAVVLAPPLVRRLPWRIAAWSWAGARLTEGRQSDGLIRLVAAGAVACSIVLPLLELEPLITETFPLSQAPQAIENVRARRGIKTAIRPGQ